MPDEFVAPDAEIERLAKHRRRDRRAQTDEAPPTALSRRRYGPDDGFLFLLRLAAIADATWRPLLILAVVIAALAWTTGLI